MPAIRKRKRHISRTAQSTTLKRILNPRHALPVLGAEHIPPPFLKSTLQRRPGRDVRSRQRRDDGLVHQQRDDGEGSREQHRRDRAANGVLPTRHAVQRVCEGGGGLEDQTCDWWERKCQRRESVWDREVVNVRGVEGVAGQDCEGEQPEGRERYCCDAPG